MKAGSLDQLDINTLFPFLKTSSSDELNNQWRCKDKICEEPLTPAGLLLSPPPPAPSLTSSSLHHILFSTGLSSPGRTFHLLTLRPLIRQISHLFMLLCKR